MKKSLLNNLIFLFIIFVVSCTAVKNEQIRGIPTAPTVSIKEEISLPEKVKTLKKEKNYKGIVELYEKFNDNIKDVVSLSYTMEAYYIERKFKDVITLGDKISNLYPNYQDGRLSLMLGVAYYQNDLYEAARRNLIKAKERGIKNQILTLSLIDLYMKRGQIALALIETSDLEEDKKEYLQGLIYFHDANYEKALEKFNQANNIIKTNFYRAFCLYKLNKYDELLNLWEKGLLKESKDFNAIIANVYFKKGEILKAKEVLKEANLQNVPYIVNNIKFIDENFIFERTKFE